MQYVAELTAVDIGAYVRIQQPGRTRRGILKEVRHGDNGNGGIFTYVKLYDRSHHVRSRGSFEEADEETIAGILREGSAYHSNGVNLKPTDIILDYSPPK